MSFMADTHDDRIDGRRDGVKVAAPDGVIQRYSVEDLRKIRAGEMIVKRHLGWHIDDVAAHYRIKRSHAYFEMRDQPDWYRERIIREHLRGKVGLG